jgi:hypothetical protein
VSCAISSGDNGVLGLAENASVEADGNGSEWMIASFSGGLGESDRATKVSKLKIRQHWVLLIRGS